MTYLRVPRGLSRIGSRTSPQRTALAEFIRSRGWVVIEPFVELEGRRDRAGPELERALTRCRELRARLVVPSLRDLGADRAFLEAVIESGVGLAAADTPRLTRSTLALLHDVALCAHERHASRSRAALAAVRRRGGRLGSPRPELGARAGARVLRAKALERAAAIRPWIEEIRLGNPDASLRDLAAGLGALGIPSPRERHWGPSGVRNALLRSGAAGH